MVTIVTMVAGFMQWGPSTVVSGVDRVTLTHTHISRQGDINYYTIQ